MKCLYDLDTMRSHFVVIIFALTFALPRTFACSCSNSTPIQKSSDKYAPPEHTVFTARVVGLIGPIYRGDGKRSSSQALAIVHERYWGLPWYWPKIVLLDGSYPCDTAMADGEEYLVAGRKMRYGIVSVNGCSRTQPLKTAQVDLRALDGTHCAAPGGTVIGHVRGEWDSNQRRYKPAKVESIEFSDLSGHTYRSNVDDDGVYELRHLPSVLFAPGSRLDGHQYVSSSPWDHQFASLSTARAGLCEESNLTVRDYQLTGRLLPGIGSSVSVELAAVRPPSEPIRANSVEPDGRFYFQKLEPGEYVLSIASTLGGTNPRIFYPGVTDRGKAKTITINGREVGRSYDFDASVLPVVPIPVVLDPVADSDKYLWDFQLLDGDTVIATHRADWINVGLLYGTRGGKYRLQLYGYPHDSKDPYCSSKSVSLTAAAGIAPVHVTAVCAAINQ